MPTARFPPTRTYDINVSEVVPSSHPACSQQKCQGQKGKPHVVSVMPCKRARPLISLPRRNQPRGPITGWPWAFGCQGPLVALRRLFVSNWSSPHTKNQTTNTSVSCAHSTREHKNRCN